MFPTLPAGFKWAKIEKPTEYLTDDSRGETSGMLYHVAVSWNARRTQWYVQTPE